MSETINPNKIIARRIGNINGEGGGGMKRELKFRAWDNDVKKFYHFDLKDPSCIPIVVALGAPIMQFTGIKTLDNIEIYEGDIDDDGFVAAWSNLIGRFILVDGCEYEGFLKDEAEYLADFSSDDIIGIRGMTAVIGNIHQNPELLKTEEGE